MSDIRDRIARVLHRQATDDGEVHVLWGGVEEHEDEVAEWLPFADALLARWPVLAGVTDETVEAGALALVRHVEGGRPARPVSAHARELARVVLEAVIGKEQAGEL